MVLLIFGDVNTIDVVMAFATGLVASLTISLAYKISEAGQPNWIPRKLVHILMGSIIAFTVVTYSNLSGPTLAAGIFFTVLMFAWAHKHDLIMQLLGAGSRENESKLNTFASGIMGLTGFGTAFLVFQARPEIFVAAILAVAWGDAAGEVFGRTYGTKLIKKRIGSKSFEGTISVFLFSLLSLCVAIVFYSDACVLCVLPQLIVIAATIAFVELVSIGWTDNFLIPIVTAILMWQMLFPSMPLLPLPVS
ncbi:MAG: conserved membrane protein of unknown function [Candidatus Thorarchaeota archaeon]|nr:MAG: conserved membrane protein of unknown function [Candidatus Thorarchaeota archaeon]